MALPGRLRFRLRNGICTATVSIMVSINRREFRMYRVIELSNDQISLCLPSRFVSLQGRFGSGLWDNLRLRALFPELAERKL